MINRLGTAVAAVVLLAACSGAGRPTVADDTAPPRECSADGMTIAEVDAEGLPPDVSTTREAIIDASLACDYEALTTVGAAGPVAVTIDGTSTPVGDWETLEAGGEQILRFVAGVLALTPGESAPGEAVTWPSAVDWQFSDVSPGNERQALVDVVGEEGVFGWEETGGYAGWRTTIAADGTWTSVTLGPDPG